MLANRAAPRDYSEGTNEHKSCSIMRETATQSEFGELIRDYKEVRRV
jgi:hypothetical protein